MRRTIATLALLSAAGCQSQQFMPVQLQGDPLSISSLAGMWVGEYWGAAAGRGGSLTFTLRSGSDSLYGDVTMVDPAGQAIRAADTPDAHRTHMGASQQLRIDFVAVHADSVRGTLEPYVAPDCQCIVSTTFVGQMRGSEMKGTFATSNAGRVRAEGTWEMHRK
ncbi:MAG: hypothetical protein ABI601_14785 [bacterium]